MVSLAAALSKVVVLTCLFIVYTCSKGFAGSFVFDPCFVVQYLVSFLVLQ